MKQLYFIIFLLIILVGFVGNAARIDNDYMDKSQVVSSPLSQDILSTDSQGPVQLDQQQLLTLCFLFGTGLVGLLIIRRK